MKKKVIEFDFAKLWIGEDGIIRVSITPHTRINIEQIRELTRSYKQLSGHDQNRVLFDIAGIKTSDKKTRDYGASEEAAKLLKAAAIIAVSPLAKVTGNLFIKLGKPAYHAKLFTDEEKALAWLKGFAEKDDS
ncbi:MAG: STAS/SEC14 domain-containing protein [Candidatus Aminicenantes bacterium]|nr:STAS/SEC14 domain-containing protein [Candidatus Aminicenantes bacterium]